ncbi:MAG: isoprenylcysteine carboxylmethyltransferase family protein [Saprospiraceae bacterium]|nr:isoprenylcysteine carboxylmethyltransferase family protein [Saprospiraceae bacterium]
MDQKYWVLIVFWVAYFTIHSFAASSRLKRNLENRGISKNNYRKLYVILSTAGLLAILLYSSTFSESYLIEPNNFTKFVSLMLAAFGTIILRLAFKQYNLRGFLGLMDENQSKELQIRGILAYIRHPIYSGTILIIVGYLLYIPKLSSLIVAVCVFIYLVIGIYLEERKLITEFGQRYLDYKRKVPAIIPKLKDISFF